MKQPWYKEFWVIPTGITSLCASILGVLTVTGKAQDGVSKMVVENRAPYFRQDHKMLCDSIDSLKRALFVNDSLNKISREQSTLTYYLIKNMASSDEKTKAQNEMNEAKQAGILR
jgi:hypothetical protein